VIPTIDDGNGGGLHDNGLHDNGLHDDVVHLRRWRATDAPALVDAWRDDEISQRLPVPDRRDLDAARRWLEGWNDRFESGLAVDLVICESPRDEVCGEVGLSRIDPHRRAALIGWWLGAPSRGRGLATRAVGLMAGWALGSGWLDALLAEIDDENQRSLRLAERCGFSPLGRSSDGRQVQVLRSKRNLEIHRG
jgi:RimJ/RimL family protein N-acetyltransferase